MQQFKNKTSEKKLTQTQSNIKINKKTLNKSKQFQKNEKHKKKTSERNFE